MLVKPDGEESKENEFGLLSPSNEEAEEKAQGVVEAVGDEVKGVKKGDKVIYGVLAGELLKIKGVDYRLLHDEDVIAFLK